MSTVSDYKINSEKLLPFKINKNLLKIAMSNNRVVYTNLLEQKENDQNLNQLELEFGTIKKKLINL